MKGKNIIIIYLLLAFVTSLNAQTFESNGIKYSVYGDGKVEVKGSLKKVLSIPSTVTYRAQKYTVERIGCGAFKGSDLEQIILPATLKTIESNAFWDTKNLKRIKIPEGVEVIGNSAFRDSGIRQIMLPSTLKRIVMWAFSGSALERIELPNTLKEIEQTVFMETRNLKSIIIPEGVEKIGTWAFIFSGLEQIQLPTTLKEINQNAFQETLNLKSISIPEGVEMIGKYTFAKSGLETVVLPYSLKSQQDVYWFGGCKNLKSLIGFRRGI